jgi:hypothetical protein
VGGGPGGVGRKERKIGILLPNNQRQHRTLHIQEDVLPYALCWLLCPVSAARASIFPDGFDFYLLLDDDTQSKLFFQPV